jgi:hypothetical protein
MLDNYLSYMQNYSARQATHIRYVAEIIIIVP